MTAPLYHKCSSNIKFSFHSYKIRFLFFLNNLPNMLKVQLRAGSLTVRLKKSSDCRIHSVLEGRQSCVKCGNVKNASVFCRNPRVNFALVSAADLTAEARLQLPPPPRDGGGVWLWENHILPVHIRTAPRSVLCHLLVVWMAATRQSRPLMEACRRCVQTLSLLQLLKKGIIEC